MLWCNIHAVCLLRILHSVPALQFSSLATNELSCRYTFTNTYAQMIAAENTQVTLNCHGAVLIDCEDCHGEGSEWSQPNFLVINGNSSLTTNNCVFQTANLIMRPGDAAATGASTTVINPSSNWTINGGISYEANCQVRQILTVMNRC